MPEKQMPEYPPPPPESEAWIVSKLMTECEKHASFGFYVLFVLWYTLYALHTIMPYDYSSIPRVICARICKRSRSPESYSKEFIPPTYVAWRASHRARICKRLKESIPPAYVAWRVIVLTRQAT
jgi:hypothetical protein